MKIFTKRKILVFFLLLVIFFILNFFNVKEFFYSFSEDIQTKLWKVNSNCELIENQKIISLIAENEELKGENTFLRESLGLKNYPEISLISGRIISKDYISDSILINTGSRDGVKVGFPVVINNNILIGRISEVYDNYSRVKLLSSKDNLTDVSINGVVALAKGKGSELISLEMFPHDKDLKEGDLILTSSLGGFPEGGDISYNSSVIKRTLHTFGIPVEMSEVNVGPTVTQYTLKPAEGIKLSKITALQNDLALALASPTIRIEAPIPGRSLVGIEVGNKKRAVVGLREILDTDEFKNSPAPLLMAIGKDVKGTPTFADLAEMPHLLVGGTTGSGKTVCLNSIILSLLYRNSPDEMKLILVDPKRVEFPIYSNLEHLLCPVIYDANQTLVALKWLVGEMERRFTVLAAGHSRDIISYNQKMEKKGEDKLPYIILIIDELADLMSVKGKEIESYIVRLAQMSRATGIHLILATQRPSVEVITGLIKANITSRIALKVGSLVDSRTILDSSGAEKLLGKGDLLLLSKEFSKPKRVQSPFISENEIKKVINWITDSNLAIKEATDEIESGFLETEVEDNSLMSELTKSAESPETQMDNFYSKEDPMYEEAKRTVISSKKASTSLLQRRLGIGYARAARLMDILEERGVVGPQEGAKPREVYFSEEE
jgi:S-DNA-T family DNA segregation ATPase FtsK/SpoIIIE